MKIWQFIFPMLFLAACGTIPGVSQQGVAGVTDVKLEWCEAAKTDMPMYLCGVRWRDGKEKQNVTLTIELSDGIKLSYSASGVLAFDGQAIRAAVEQAISDDIKEAVPGIVDTIMKGLVGPIGVLM